MRGARRGCSQSRQEEPEKERKLEGLGKEGDVGGLSGRLAPRIKVL